MTIKLDDLKKLRETTGASFSLCKSALEEANGVFEDAIRILREKGIAAAAKKVDRVATQGRIGYCQVGRRSYLYELNCETDFVANTDTFRHLQTLIEQALQTKPVADISELSAIEVAGRSLESYVKEAAGSLGENVVLRRLVYLDTQGTEAVYHYLHGDGRIGVLVALNQDDAQSGLNLALQIAAMAPEYPSRDDVPATRMEEARAIFMKQLEDSQKPTQIIEKIVDGKIKNWYKEIVLLDQNYIKDDQKTVSEYLSSLGLRLKTFKRIALGEASS